MRTAYARLRHADDAVGDQRGQPRERGGVDLQGLEAAVVDPDQAGTGVHRPAHRVVDPDGAQRAGIGRRDAGERVLHGAAGVADEQGAVGAGQQPTGLQSAQDRGCRRVAGDGQRLDAAAHLVEALGGERGRLRRDRESEQQQQE